MSNPIGVVTTIRYKDSDDVLENFYISFEDVPDDVDDDYVLPLAGITDSQVGFYTDYETFMRLVEISDEGFIISDYKFVTPACC